uniref:Fanconi-associated nuclease n=1 Tax=Caenorhabditis tropicalis TaxID=1561998 RepID=A0A1I7UNS6_9PELO
MKKAKKEKFNGPVEPVSYNRSILAAFEKQSRGKVCPLCNAKFSLASYKTHMDTCKVAEDDDDIEILASYTRQEAVLLRAGPAIVLEDQSLTETPQKKRRTEEREEEVTENSSAPTNYGDFDLPGPSGINENLEASSQSSEKTNESVEKVIKKSPVFENTRRRSTRIQLNSQNSQNTRKETIVKKETATIAEVIQSITSFETRIENSDHRWPYYMKYTVKILKRVITTKKFDGTFYSDDFWLPSDVITFYRFVELLTESAKCLLVRLFIRKSGWYQLEKLEQKYPEIPNIKEAAVELTKWKFVNDDSCLKTLDEALQISDVSVLKNVAKNFKIDGIKNRQELVHSLRKFAQSQQSIFGGTGNVETDVIKSIKKELGTCLKIQSEFVDLFRCLFTIYCPVTTNSANSIDNPAATNVYQDLLYMMNSIEKGEVSFPALNPCRNISSFYKDRQMLMEYVTAKSIETTIVLQMTSGNFDVALDLAIDAKEFIDQMPDAHKRYYESLEIHERKFTSIWVHTRCCGHATTLLERQKKWGMAVEWQKDLLILNKDVQAYCCDSRGIWWDRMLLNLDSHMKEKKDCAKMIQLAIQDTSVLEKELLSIQDRALKLKEMPTDFKPPLNIGTPQKRTIVGKTISKNLGDGRVNRFVIRDDGKEEDVECSVEEVARRWFLENEGYTIGVHDEGATWHTLFGLLFYDVIFSMDKSVASTWHSEVQDCPSDLSNTLYSKRKEKFEERFEWLIDAEEELIEDNIRKIWELKKNETNRECSWKHFPSGADDCVGLFQCIPRSSLISICRRLAENYRNSRSGFPDLTLWNRETKSVAVIEVKGPGDRLSTKQRLWLAFFADNGITAEVCHVEAQNSRLLV